MTIYDLKPKFQALLRPIVESLHVKGITPNQVTWAALILSIITGVLVAATKGATWTLLLVPFVMFIRMALNAIDGILAKEHDMTSDAGAMLNELGDVISDAALYLPLAFIAGLSPVLVVLFVVIGLLTEVAGILGAVIGGTRRYDGPMGKSDRAFVVGLLALLIGLGLTPGWWADGLLLLSIGLGIVTVLNRAKRGLVS
ncbi:MAG TPA: CDP-alcohol phosphatidyltransferase family protein [Epsilonproteobacteria bacterium]|nr:CDP-alcohol phosphatidyltransferase family protein [Campylobacterota bacterium]